MSAAKMGEYVEASARRRETILEDQKFPPRFKQVLYKEAIVAIRSALIRGGDVETALLEAARRVEAKARTSEYDQRASECSAAAIRRFAKLYESIPLKNATASPVAAGSLNVFIEGVKISVMPLVMLNRAAKGEEERGAMLVVFQKGAPLGTRSMKAVAALLREALVARGFANVRPELCIVIDVFAGRIETATARGQRMADDLASACREIATRWPTLRARRVA